MRTLGILLRKEFLQIFRNRGMLPILFGMPFIQLMILAFAVTYEVRDTPVSLVDDDRSWVSERLVDRLEASGYFRIVSRPGSMDLAGEDIRYARSKMILHVPRDFERDLRTTSTGRLQIVLNAEDGAAAGVIQAYVMQVIAAVNREIQVEYLPVTAATATDGTAADLSAPAIGAGAGLGSSPVAGISVGSAPVAGGIRIVPRHWYNPALDYQTFMVPGILVLLVTLIGTFLSSMNVVREKEIGTIEQLNVTPIRKQDFLVAKLLPFWIIALVELAFGLVVARFVFGIPMLGSLPLLFALAGVYLLVMLGIGLWISTITDTQQQAMFVAWFIMVVCIMMSGLFTPIDSMPVWAQKVTLLNPIAYFIEIMRRVLLKGAGLADVKMQAGALVVYAAVMLTLAVRQYHKTTA